MDKKKQKIINWLLCYASLAIALAGMAYMLIAILLPNISLNAFITYLPIIIAELTISIILFLWLIRMEKIHYTKRQWKIRGIILLAITIAYFVVPYILLSLPRTNTGQTKEYSLGALIIGLYVPIFVLLISLHRAWLLHQTKESLNRFRQKDSPQT